MDNYFVGSTLSDVQNARTAALQIDEQRRNAAAQRFFDMLNQTAARADQAAARSDQRRAADADRAQRYSAMDQDSGLRGREMDLRSRGMDRDYEMKGRGMGQDYFLGMDRNQVERERFKATAAGAAEQLAMSKTIAEIRAKADVEAATATAQRYAGMDPRLQQDSFRAAQDVEAENQMADVAAAQLNARLAMLESDRDQKAARWGGEYFGLASNAKAGDRADAEFQPKFSELMAAMEGLPVTWDSATRKFVSVKRKAPAAMFQSAPSLVPPASSVRSNPTNYFGTNQTNVASPQGVRQWDTVNQRFAN